MKLVLLVFVIIAGVVFYFKSPNLHPTQNKSSNTLSVANKPVTIPDSNVLGTTAQTIQNTVTQIIPPQAVEKIITDTTTKVVNNVQADVNAVVSQAVNDVLASQLVNNFKNLPQPIQEQVKQNICK